MLRLITIPLLLVLLVLRSLLWLLFVPLGRVLLKVSRLLGPLRLPFLLLCAPIVVPCVFLDRGTGGRMLEGELIRPTFTLPFAFARGPWTVRAEQNVRSAELELVEGDQRSTLSITASATLAEVRRDDEAAARIIEKALAEPPLPNGMRWAGMRVTTFLPDSPLTCLYVVWQDDAPDRACINVRFTGAPEHERFADEFVNSVMPELPVGAEEDEDDALEPGASA